MTDRIPLDHLTSDQLDALYDQLDEAAPRLSDMTRDRDRWRWYAEDARRRIKIQAARAERAEDAIRCRVCAACRCGQTPCVRTGTLDPTVSATAPTHHTRHLHAAIRTWTGQHDPQLDAWLGAGTHHWKRGGLFWRRWRLVIHTGDGDIRPRPGWCLVRWPDGMITVTSPRVVERVWEPIPAATGATEPAMITNPAHLRNLYAAALYERERPPRDPHWPDVYAADREVFEAMADAVARVRDRYVEQLRQRLELAQATLNAEAEHDSADASAGSYAHRAEHAEQQRDQLAATLREVLDQFADWPTGGFPWPQGGVVARIDTDQWDRWDATLTAVTAPCTPAHLADLTNTDTLEDPR